MANIKINIKDLAIYLPKKTANNSELDKIFNQTPGPNASKEIELL